MKKRIMKLLSICLSFAIIICTDAAGVTNVSAASGLTGTSISSSTYKISSNKAIIGVPLKPISVTLFKSNISKAKGAVVNVLKKDGKTVVAEGNISSGMKVKIVAPDKKTTKVYTIYRLKPDKWEGETLAVGGTYADAEVVELEDGTYRMYYCIEGEVAGNQKEIYSAVSEDGRTWTKEEGVRRINSVFPDIVRLSDGSWRMYYANAGGIASCTSADGLEWTDDEDYRIKNETDHGLVFENIGSSSTIRLSDGTYVMSYNGSINEAYSDDVPNYNTTVIMWATSKDGINFEKKGIAVDSRNSDLIGLAASPEFYCSEDGTINMYFWGYMGIYKSTYKNGKFTKPVLDYTVCTENTLTRGFPYPYPSPGDPSLIKIGDTLFMFYGYHTVGIHYVTEKK